MYTQVDPFAEAVWSYSQPGHFADIFSGQFVDLHFLQVTDGEVVDPSIHHGNDQVFFGATVTYAKRDGEEQTITIVGIDEFDPLKGKVSWISPVARTLTKAREGDTVLLHTPNGAEELEILEVSYPAPVP